jgi:hypothetical protein
MDFIRDDGTYQARLVRLLPAPPVNYQMASPAKSIDLEHVNVRLHGGWLAVTESGSDDPDLYPAHRVIEIRGLSAPSAESA